jgi:hypothetical protein
VLLSLTLFEYYYRLRYVRNVSVHIEHVIQMITAAVLTNSRSLTAMLSRV